MSSGSFSNRHYNADSMFFDFRTYFKIIRLALTDKLNPKRLLVHISLIVLLSLWEGLGIDSAHAEDATRALVDGCIRDYHYAMQVLEELPEDRYAIVEYDNLVADPKATVEEVYARLNLEISSAFDTRLSSERSRQKRYHSMNAYSLDQFGIDAAEIEERLGTLNQRFGFTRDVG